MWKCQPITVVGSRFFLSAKKGLNSEDILYKDYTHQKGDQKSKNNIKGLKSNFNSLDIINYRPKLMF